MQTVYAKDGTPLAYDQYGSGPAVVLVDGAFCNRTFGPMPKLAPLLAPSYTVYAYDRRGRGDSGDTKPYTVQHEIDDLETMINVAGGSAFVVGVSSGAMLTLLAASQGLPIQKLAVYEPPYVADNKFRRPTRDHAGRLDDMIRAGKQDAAMMYYFTKVIGLPRIVPFVMRWLPMWSQLKRSANALPYDARIAGDFFMPPTLNTINIPVLVIGGERSPAMLRAAVAAVAGTIPAGRSIILPKQTHNVDAKVLAGTLHHFFN